MATTPAAPPTTIESFLSEGVDPWRSTYSLQFGVSESGYQYLELVIRSQSGVQTVPLGGHPSTPSSLAEALSRAATQMKGDNAFTPDMVTWTVKAGETITPPDAAL